MSYGIIRVQKVKSSGVGAMQYHNDRMPGRHSNEDIDQSRTRLNEELVPHLDYASEVEERIRLYRKSDRAVRKDAVVLVEGVVTASPEFFEGKSADEIKAFFKDAYEFVKAEAGEENLIHFTIHMDESTPHAHFGFTPIKDGSLSWKKFFDGKYALRGFQDRFWEQVGRPWGLERGEKSENTGRKHKTTAQMKRDGQRELRALEREVAQKQEQKRELTTAIADRRGDLAKVDSAVEDAELRLEGLRRATEAEAEAVADLDRAIEQTGMEPAAETLGESVRALWTARNDGSREEGLASEIEGLRSRISASEGECERLRGRVGELERGLPGLRGRHRVLRERFDALERRLTAVIERLGEIPNTVSEWAQDLARELGKRVYNPRSPDYVVSQSKAFTSNRGRAPIERDEGRGWSR